MRGTAEGSIETVLLAAAFALSMLSGQSGHVLAATPGIIGTDDRVPVTDTDDRWLSIGQVNVGGYSRRSICSGTLVSPRSVLTAAHCVFDFARHRPFPARNVHFAAGVHRDRVAGRAMAKCVLFPPRFDPEVEAQLLPDISLTRLPNESFRDDLALIVLDRAIDGVKPMPLAGTGILARKSPVTLAGYPVDRRYILSYQEDCEVLDMVKDVAFVDCDAKPGTSGAPVLVKAGSGYRIAGVLTGHLQIGEANVVTSLSSWPGLAADAACPGQ